MSVTSGHFVPVTGKIKYKNKKGWDRHAAKLTFWGVKSCTIVTTVAQTEGSALFSNWSTQLTGYP